MGNPVVVVNQSRGPGCLIRILWFLCLGLWLGAIVTVLAWGLIVTIIGLPLGLWLLNRLPQIMTLSPAKQGVGVTIINGTTVISTTSVSQHGFLARAIYFLVIGWWFSAIWLILAWSLVALILTMPLAFWMFDRVPQVTTLARR